MTEKTTEQRVLESACAIFASKGFRNATVADICSAANANIASVNYYFRNKEGLYREVWRYVSDISERKYPYSCADDADPDKNLRTYISNRIRSIFDTDPAGWFPRIINREMADPSPMGDELYKDFLVPRRKNLEKLVRKLLGTKATDRQISICAFNILSIYAFINIARKPRQHLFGAGEPSPEQLNILIHQMQDFASGAVNGVRAAMENKKEE